MNTTKNPGNAQATVDNLGLLVSSRFIPFSQSRNAKEKFPSLNWEVTLYTLSPLDGQRRDILSTMYGAGSAHCPAYKATVRTLGNANSVMRSQAIAWECENGYAAFVGENTGMTMRKGKPLEPKALDVIDSLVMDSDVLDAGGFESWASDLGYDVDSRKAEKIYQACIELALKLRSAIGDAGLTALREAFQEY